MYTDEFEQPDERQEQTEQMENIVVGSFKVTLQGLQGRMCDNFRDKDLFLYTDDDEEALELVIKFEDEEFPEKFNEPKQEKLPMRSNP